MSPAVDRGQEDTINSNVITLGHVNVITLGHVNVSNVTVETTWVVYFEHNFISVKWSTSYRPSVQDRLMYKSNIILYVLTVST